MQIVTAKEMYEIDRLTIEKGGVDGKLLMENAGRSIVNHMLPIIDRTKSILVLVGGGNNGGDGFVIARTLLTDGYDVLVVQLVPDYKIKGEAAYHKQLWLNFGGIVHVFQDTSMIRRYLLDADIVVDAMLGIGISGEVRQPLKDVIGLVNQVEALTISVDIPSGLPADEGESHFEAVVADYTFIVEHPKMSLFLESCSPFYGKWEVVKIGLFHSNLSSGSRIAWRERDVKRTLPKRSRNSHKGTHGRGLVIGGSSTMPGSIAMTLKAALRSGAGLITGGTINEVFSSIASHCVEATYLPLLGKAGAMTTQPVDVSMYNAIAIGMGMGRNEETAAFTRQLVKDVTKPILIDADGLHHIKDDLASISQRKQPTILTPHPGEMAMLTGISVREILLHPFEVSKQFAYEHNVYLVLKGPHTIITDPNGNQLVNTTGNQGLAKGGSGDVLSGVLLAMIMQEQSMIEALANGCFIHGKSADLLISSHRSTEDLLATDVIDGLASVFRTL
ncbi:NAD(P)H-hydrate dehydratase [Aquibacillus koreensis]|uniref:Bifunctional NAD(P)H-hydrate repair enzyme n=1 Tax=Aquibacillus koreensis TaxID=279446 RepID=A0A9X3WP42_9BACI|nr:NAD(P)H-hydrate dehydratase [Aquibacillus koreensis]MCT2534958.1 NAD(P)H-hydrate dehydratase [Aquibacillus koreensis]MDC3422148.1 NAD(P)H-hydrate dehydratase [Aquibacillus koreensis]